MAIRAAISLHRRLGFLLALTLILSGCRRPTAEVDGGSSPLVVAGDGVLCDLSRTLAADDLPVACLLEPGVDPHGLSLSPSQARTLRRAELVLINGLGLTPALAAPPTDGTVVAVAEEASLETVPLEEDGHGHGDRDPHVWHDPRNTARMVEVVSRELATLAPEAEPRLTARTRRATAVLSDLDAWALRQFAGTAPGHRVLATTHRAFATYASRYGLRELPLLDAFGGEGVLRPETLSDFQARLERAGVKVLFAEQSPPAKALQTLSRRSGIPLARRPLRADGLAPGLSTVGTFVENTCTIVEGLGGSCDRKRGEELDRRWRAIGAG